jgi:hypothetical protein
VKTWLSDDHFAMMKAPYPEASALVNPFCGEEKENRQRTTGTFVKY